MSARPLFRVVRSYAEQVTDGEWLSVKNLVWVGIALTVGFFVRVNELGAQSLWNDEGTSVALAQRSVSAIVTAASQDIHPPLYYILLSGWIQLAGTSEFAIRFLSVIAGMLLIAVTFRIAREFFDQDVAVLAAVVSALNPFQVYYAQETRMYIWVTLFGAVSVWAMVVMFKPPRDHAPPLSHRIRRRLGFFVVYIVTALAALYTNYYAFTLILFENLAFLAWFVWALRANRPRLGHSVAFWVIAQIILAIAYLPWLILARQSLTSWPGISEPMTLWEMGWRIASAFVTGVDSPLDFRFLLVITYVLFFVGGLLPSRDLFKHSVWGIVTCFLWAVVPLFAMYVVSLTRPAYNPKFLLLATPGFLILVARGVSIFYPGLFMRERAPQVSLNDSLGTRLGRQWTGIGKLLVGGLFAAGTILALQNLATDSRLERDDYRGIVNFINAVATERDAVIVNAPGQLDVVRYYYNSPAQLIGVPIGRPLQHDATTRTLDSLSTRENLYGIFWATEQADPDSLIERHLAETTYKASDEWYGNVRLVHYALPLESKLKTMQTSIRFGDEILLESYKYPPPPQPVENVVPIVLEWRPLKFPPTARYKVFAQLLDSHGRLASQHDTEPRDGYFPTIQWTRDEPIVDRLAVPIPAGLTPGIYRLIIGLYRGDTGERLLASSGGDFFALGTVAIRKRVSPREAFLFTPVPEGAIGAIDLVGFQVEQTPFARGGFVPLMLYFQTRENSARDIELRVELRDQGNNVIASARAFELYPTSRWDMEEIVRDVHRLAVPSDALPGEYNVVVTDGARTLDVTRVQVR